MKYNKDFKVGDIIGYGAMPYIHAAFIITQIDNNRYYLNTIDGKKSLSPVKRIIDSPGTTFRKVSKAELLLYYKGDKGRFEIFLKICDKLELPKGFRPPPPSY